MTLRSHQEEGLHLHILFAHSILERNTSFGEFAEEQSCGETELNIGEVNTKTDCENREN